MSGDQTVKQDFLLRSFASFKLRAFGRTALVQSLELATTLVGSPTHYQVVPGLGLALFNVNKSGRSSILSWSPERFADDTLDWINGLSDLELREFDSQPHYDGVWHEHGAFEVSVEPSFTDECLAVIKPVFRDVHK